MPPAPVSKPVQYQDAESQRLASDASRESNWKRWGPYLSERQWGTVREDYSPDGDCWNYLSHDDARSRAYRWGEDGLLGITDRQCRLCFSIALWNGRDHILKERLFGLTNPQGNHGEDVKECYFYLDSTPTHSYMKALYKYPQAAFPYQQLIDENHRRTAMDREFEIIDTGVFGSPTADGLAGGNYFDVFAEYAKNTPNDLLIRLTIANRSTSGGPANITVLPQLWFRNTWSWGRTSEGYGEKPRLAKLDAQTVLAEQDTLGRYKFWAGPGPNGQSPQLLFTDNESNRQRLWNVPNPTPYVKDAFNEYIVHGNAEAVNPAHTGTKVGAHYQLQIPAGGQVVLTLRLSADAEASQTPFGPTFDKIFAQRMEEADAFFHDRLHPGLEDSERQIARQAYAGLLWSRQFYHYVVQEWLDGDPGQPPPPPERKEGRNADWGHLYNRDVISMPDKWEYPWYAAWDLAFHMIPFSRIDPEFAKEQLVLMLREWYMHPNGQIPAYEFAFGDVNPPVHAWACWRVYKMTGPRGRRDRLFLARAFQKLLINFTWWVNRKDVGGKHIFAGGFLGLDNIGVFDRSKPLPSGVQLAQADGTAWMAFYCSTMLAMALELAREDPAYEDVASKFFEHFVAIVDAMNTLGGTGLWDDHDGFYYDQLQVNGDTESLKVRSMVGLIPLFAVEVLEDDTICRLPGFSKRMKWFLENRQDLARNISYMEKDHAEGTHAHYLLAIPSRERLERVLRYMLDESEFLSPYGLRSLSRVHEKNPYIFRARGQEFRVDYTPGESTTGLFGGNSNWRGPVWFPVNFLMLESLERYHHFYGDDFKIECPTGSGRFMNLYDVAQELRLRLSRLFMPNTRGERPCHGGDLRYASDPHWKDLLLFHEYFHADSGRGLGASHQTGWTALVARCLDNLGQREHADQHGLAPAPGPGHLHDEDFAHGPTKTAAATTKR